MNITPHLGIGDMILVKMKEVSNNLNITHININNQLIRTYSENYDAKLKSIAQFIHLLFPTATISANDNPCDFIVFVNNYRINQLYLYNHINDNLLNKCNSVVEDITALEQRLLHYVEM